MSDLPQVLIEPDITDRLSEATNIGASHPHLMGLAEVLLKAREEILQLREQVNASSNIATLNAIIQLRAEVAMLRAETEMVLQKHQKLKAAVKQMKVRGAE